MQKLILKKNLNMQVIYQKKNLLCDLKNQILKKKILFLC